MPRAEHDGVGLAYERAGTPSGETVVFVEGLGYGRWMWNWQREALADEYDLLLWDNRGTGESDTPQGPYTIPEMAGDLAAVLDAAGVDGAHVVGASMGGMIAQEFAIEYDRAETLTLFCTTPGGPDAHPTPDATVERMFAVPDGLDQRESIRYKMRPALTDGFWAEQEATVDRIVEWRIESDAPGRARAWQATAVEKHDASDRLDRIDVPTLVMHGERDEVVPVANARLLAAGIPEATLVTVDEGGSHLFFVERAETVNGRLREFLAG